MLQTTLSAILLISLVFEFSSSTVRMVTTQQADNYSDVVLCDQFLQLKPLLRDGQIARLCNFQDSLAPDYGTQIGQDAAAQYVNKRKNEFMRFGRAGEKLADVDKWQLFRFQKRKNEFMRFGRSVKLTAYDSKGQK